MRRRGLRLRIAGVAALAPLAAGCTQEGSAAGGAEIAEGPPELVIFVYDRSTSIDDYQLDLARELTNERIGQLTHNDRIAALQLLQLSLEEPPKRWAQSVPRRQWQQLELARDSITRARFLKDAQDYLVAFTDTANREHIDGTDILSTLHDVAAELRAWPNREATLYIFSDMLQSNRTIDMEGLRKMPPPDWVATEKAGGTLPDLTGLCIVVVGARVDTEAAQRVKDFWEEYFEATGAILEDRNYMLRPVKLPSPACA
ncbi:MAG: hypothetical protein ACE5JR_01380 [Gemmatimonadota bacterium]